MLLCCLQKNYTGNFYKLRFYNCLRYSQPIQPTKATAIIVTIWLKKQKFSKENRT